MKQKRQGDWLYARMTLEVKHLSNISPEVLKVDLARHADHIRGLIVVGTAGYEPVAAEEPPEVSE